MFIAVLGSISPPVPRRSPCPALVTIVVRLSRRSGSAIALKPVALRTICTWPFRVAQVLGNPPFVENAVIALTPSQVSCHAADAEFARAVAAEVQSECRDGDHSRPGLQTACAAIATPGRCKLARTAAPLPRGLSGGRPIGRGLEGERAVPLLDREAVGHRSLGRSGVAAQPQEDWAVCREARRASSPSTVTKPSRLERMNGREPGATLCPRLLR